MAGVSEVRASDTLSEFERAELVRIERALDDADDMHRREVGRLLLEVREKRLWREGFGSFEEYVEARHKISRQKAWVVAGFADVQRDVPEIAVESHARPLISVAPEERQAVWEEAKASAGEKPVTAKHVEAAAKARPRKPGPDASGDEIEEYMRASGVVPEGAEIQTDRFGDPDAEEPEEDLSEPTDEEWLESLPARKELPPNIRKNFDADALLFRKATEFRLAYVESLRKPASEAKKSTGGHIGAWLSKTYRYFQTNDPSRWRCCDECLGSGRLKLLGKCPECRGEGYLL